MRSAATMVARRSKTARVGLRWAILATFALAWAPVAQAIAAGAFTAPDDPGVPTLISSLRGCLANLSPTDRRVLTLRAGVGGRRPELTVAVAADIRLTPAAATTAEVGAIRRLEAQHRSGACQIQPVAAAGKAAPAPAKSSSPSTTGVLDVVIPALLVLAFFAGISLEMNRRPHRG